MPEPIKSFVTPPAPIAAAPIPPAPAVGFAETAPLTEGALAKAPAPVTETNGTADAERLRSAVVAALVDGGHASAGELLRGSSFLLEGGSLRIEVPGVGKKMLGLTVNAAAEKLIRQELQRLNAPTRFMVVPGTGSAAATGEMAPVVGSIQEAALAHPLVNRAREIFKAEVRSIVDLRQK
jgi:DNA polymerase III subunit gamma/tau